MGAPEKIFICDYGSEVSYEWHSESEFETKGHNDIEYTRTDVFIEKAEKFLKTYRRETLDKTGYISGVVDDKMIEDFKNYMKGE